MAFMDISDTISNIKGNLVKSFIFLNHVADLGGGVYTKILGAKGVQDITGKPT